MRNLWLAVATGLLMVACGSSESNAGPNEPTETADAAESTENENTAELSTVTLFTSGEDRLGEGEDAEVGGLLALVDGCIFLGSPDTFLQLVIWPFGTTWDEQLNALVLGNGVEIALGDLVSAGGGYSKLSESILVGQRFDEAQACNEVGGPDSDPEIALMSGLLEEIRVTPAQ